MQTESREANIYVKKGRVDARYFYLVDLTMKINSYRLEQQTNAP